MCLSRTTKLIKTNILKQQEIAYISNQREIKNETETVTNQEYDLPVIEIIV